MAAAYDTYNYSAYWDTRRYEHESEIIAIKKLLEKVPKSERILEVGGGFGRLTPSYIHRARKIYLSDPSSKLLKIARSNLHDKKITFVHSKLDNLDTKVRAKSIDLLLMVRVLHHMDDIEEAFTKISKLLSSRGFLILEFANKLHFKSKLINFLKGNITYPMEIYPEDIRSKKNKSKKTLPFNNFHPDDVIEKLKECDFEIIEKLSVSNIRSDRLKNSLPLETLTYFEKILQKVLSYINFGPSIFILARKKG